jgi:PEP-CTERM motif-containing protein
MKSGSLFTRAAVLVTTLFVAGGFASGDIVNGSFDTGTTYGWMVLPFSITAYNVMDITESSKVLMLDASNTFNEEDAPEQPESSLTVVQPDGIVASSLYAPAGTNAMEFYAKAVVVGTTWPTMDVQVNYTDLSSVSQTASHIIAESNAGWQLRTIDLTGIDTSQSVSFQIRVINDQDPDGGLSQSIGYYDDFAFVPEPATMTLLALGGIAMLRRRRR